MSQLPAPTADNNMLLHPMQKLDFDFLQGLLTELHSRFNAIELITGDVQAELSAETSTRLQNAFDNTLSPLLQQALDTVAQVQSEVGATQDQLFAIQQGGVGAANVTVDTIEGLDATTAQAAMAELLGLLEKSSFKSRFLLGA